MTENPRAVQHGRYGRKYRYGEALDDTDSEEEESWPKGAAFQQGYFPESYHVRGRYLSNHHVLQYAFKNGFEMGKGKSAPGVSAYGKMVETYS